MKVLKKLIHLHRNLFCTAIFLTLFSVVLNLCWNGFLANVLNILVDSNSSQSGLTKEMSLEIGAWGVMIVIALTASEYIASYVFSYTCELWAHDMRMGYAKYYLLSDIQTLAKLNVGEEQSAMGCYPDCYFFIMELYGAYMQHFLPKWK